MISGDDDNDDSFLDIDDCVFVKFLVFINKHEQLIVCHMSFERILK